MDVAEAFPEHRFPVHWLEQLYFRKCVRIEPDSRLAAIVGDDDMSVNSIHKQAVHRVGEGLRIAAREQNGAVQAIEDPRRRFWLGVQFHPEFLFYRARCQAIFRAFVAAARHYSLERRGRGAPAFGEAS
jgi:putative glutamine amidotransferase